MSVGVVGRVGMITNIIPSNVEEGEISAPRYEDERTQLFKEGLSSAEGIIRYVCGCSENNLEYTYELFEYHENLAAAEELMYGP
jgi:hypothetical protein